MATATPTALESNEVERVIAQAKADALATPPRTVAAGGTQVQTPYPSPEDWRDRWIYFLLVDRFNNPNAAPKNDDPYLPYQGGTFEGIRQQIAYIKGLGAGAIWISPVLMNPQSFGDYYGGYATQDFLRIEPRFCKNPAQARTNPEVADQEFRALVDEIHAAGMHVILDIVLNHAGDLFNYEGAVDAKEWRSSGPYDIYWRDPAGVARGDWTEIENIPSLPRDAGVWPRELQKNGYFRRQGDVNGSGDPTRGDFGRLKELVTEWQQDGRFDVRDTLIRSYQYLVAKFDLDGFRVDTLMYVERDFARTFANSMREFALSIGKKNFFTFGEVWVEDDEAAIAKYIGRDTNVDDEGIVGFDAALDFPLRLRLEQVCKGVMAPAALAEMMTNRLQAQRSVLSSHGDVGAYFVTFLENHDLNARFAAGTQHAQVTLALTCLFTMQGVPSVYYGIEQGMNGSGPSRESARACLWRAPSVFSQSPQSALYQTIASLAALRQAQPALRYGRQYYRELSGDDIGFGFSPSGPGVIAFSRILNDTEIVVVANCNQAGAPLKVSVVVDRRLNPPQRQMAVLFTNLTSGTPTAPSAARIVSLRTVVSVTLRPMEAQVLG